MHCGNCGLELGDDVGPAVSKILDSRYMEDSRNSQIPSLPNSPNSSLATTTTCEDLGLGNTDDNVDVDATSTTAAASDIASSPQGPQEISIVQALSVIFEIPPLSSKMKGKSPDPEAVLHPNLIFRHDGTDELNLCLCLGCAETLTLLYNSFKEFTQLCKLECAIALKLKELEELRHRQDHCEISIEGSLKTPTPLKSPKKRGRPKKPKASEVTTITSPIKRRKADVADGEEKEDEDEGILKKSKVKDELESEPEVNNYVEFENYDEDEMMGISPPDSPVNLDLTEVPPRSPRPVRKNSARNKDWSKLYKDELFSDEEEEQELDQADPKVTADLAEAEANIVVPFSESEMTGDQDQDQTDADASDFQMEEPEEDPLALEPDEDEDDEEYRPDSDLEDLKAAVEAGRARKKRTYSFSMRVRPQKKLHKADNKDKSKTSTKDSKPVCATFLCSLCEKRYARKDHLQRHMRAVHGEGISSRVLKEELENTFDSIRQFECPVCQLPFSRSKIQKHVDEHEIDYPWRCEKTACSKTFAFFTDYRTHWVEHRSQDKEACPICRIEFRNLSYLRTHQEKIHHVRSSNINLEQDLSSGEDEPEKKGSQVGMKAFKCSECEKRYARRDKLTEHLISHGIGDKFNCPVCERDFNHERTLIRHMFLHSSKNPHKCQEEGCDKGYARREHLAKHMELAHSTALPLEDVDTDTETKFSDEDVEAKGNNKNNDNAISKTSTTPKGRGRGKVKEKILQCHDCGKMIKRERMRLHLVSHTGERKHTCDVCGAKFGLRTTLLTHVKCVHNGLRRYQCRYCEMAFKRSNHLKDHEKLHTDADSKPFSCPLCDKSFRRDKNLKSHMISHTGSKDFVCELCGKSFSRVDNMRAHVKTVHEGLQIRKKRPPSAVKYRSSSGSGRRKPGTNSNKKVDASDTELTEEMFPDSEGITLVLAGGSSSMQDANAGAGSNSTVIVTNKKSKKRAGRPRKKILEEQVEVDMTHEEISTEGTIMTLTLDPTTGNMIPADGLGTVQIQEMQTEGEVQVGVEGQEGFGEQRATILQLAPGQVYTASQDGNGVTYYQYTYYQP